MIVGAFASTILCAHTPRIRRCNLACEYCNEYDAQAGPDRGHVSAVDNLAELGTWSYHRSGGEPLFAELDEIIRAFANAA